MHTIERLQPEHIPLGYFDFRQTKGFARYMERIGWKSVGIEGSFGFVLKTPFCFIAKYLCTDEEPDIDEIRNLSNRRHGIVLWRRWRVCKTPLRHGWHRMWGGLEAHINGNGFGILQKEYQSFWSPRARRNLRFFSRSGGSVYNGSFEEFREGMNQSTLDRSFQRGFLGQMEITRACMEVDFLICSDRKGYLGGLVVANHGTTSVHYYAFNTVRGNALQAGTGLVDAWYQRSLERGIWYMNFDNVSQPGDPRDWRGFSEFKRNFIQYEVELPREYFLIV